MLYSGIGAGAGASLCYPDEAKEITDITYQEGRKNALIAYNFITGGKLKENSDSFLCVGFENVLFYMVCFS